MAHNSDHFDLSGWKLTLPVDGRGGHGGLAQDVLHLARYESDFFYDAADRAMVFRASVDGATTSGSKYARSELREMVGDQRAAWDLATGGTATATLKIDAVPTTGDGTRGKVVVGQIHGGDDELVRLYWEKGTVYFKNDQAGAKDEELRFDLKDAKGLTPKISLGEKFSYKIEAKGDTLNVSVYADGRVYSSDTKINAVWQSDKFYFKAGLYLGVNETNGTGSGQASFYRLDYGHNAGQGLAGLVGPGRSTNGEDSFVFDNKLGSRAEAVAHFNVREDAIWLDHDIFTAFHHLGKLGAAAFWANGTGKAHDATDRIIYERDTGKLRYDADGTGSGAAVHFATLDKDLHLTTGDFLIV